MLHEGIYALPLLPNLLLESRRMGLAAFKLLAALVAGASKLLSSLGLNSQLLRQMGHKEVLCCEIVNMPLLYMKSPLQVPDRSLLVLKHSMQLVVARDFGLRCFQKLLEMSKELPGRGVGRHLVKSIRGYRRRGADAAFHVPDLQDLQQTSP